MSGLTCVNLACADIQTTPVDMGQTPVDMGQMTTDMGQMTTDMGQMAVDMGPPDMGPPDLGPPAEPILRVVHAVSDTGLNGVGNPGMGILPIGVRACVDTSGGLFAAGLPLYGAAVTSTESPFGLPFRAITPYLQDTGVFTAAATIRVYDHRKVDIPAMSTVACPGSLAPANTLTLDSDCTDDEDASMTDLGCAFQFDFDPTMLTADKHYTVIMQGLLSNPGSIPNADFDVIVLEDEEQADAVASMTRLRTVTAIPNFPAAADLCVYGADVRSTMDGMTVTGTPLQTGLVPNNVASGATPQADYETVPSLSGGLLYLTVRTTANPCEVTYSTFTSGTAPADNPLVPVITNLAAYQANPADIAAFNAVFPSGGIVTVFFTGDATQTSATDPEVPIGIMMPDYTPAP